jgi:hypothetical protein
VEYDKVRINGSDFTRVGDGYLLQSEVEEAFSGQGAMHVDRLTTLLEDIVSTADAVALEVVETQTAQLRALRYGPQRQPDSSIRLELGARSVLAQVRDGLHDQMLAIDGFLHRLDG